MGAESQLDKAWEKQLQLQADYTEELDDVLGDLEGKEGTSQYLELTRILADHEYKREQMLREMKRFVRNSEMDTQNAMETRKANAIHQFAKDYNEHHVTVLVLSGELKELYQDRDNKNTSALTKNGETIHQTIIRYEGLLELAIQERRDVADKFEGWL